jgi:hypothetical protein
MRVPFKLSIICPRLTHSSQRRDRLHLVLASIVSGSVASGVNVDLFLLFLDEGLSPIHA